MQTKANRVILSMYQVFASPIESLSTFCCLPWFIRRKFTGEPYFPVFRTSTVSVTMRISPEFFNRNVTVWLRQGISPRRLAVSLALGFAIGCIPVVGIPTLVCAVLALTLRLNLPAIQAANYAVMPLQLVLIVPFVRLGEWLLPSGPRPVLAAGTLLHPPTASLPVNLLVQIGSLAGQAMVAWLLIAGPAVVVMTFTLTPLLRRIPALAKAEAAD